MDVTELILQQHTLQRQMFSWLDEIDPADTAALASVWSRLAILLEVHASAEELHVYPILLRIGVGENGSGPDNEVLDVINDHNQIRDSVRSSLAAETGTDEWWQHVLTARLANDDHMREEEGTDLPDLRRHSSLEQRHAMAIAFIEFLCEHIALGVPGADTNAQEYLNSNGTEIVPVGH